MQATKWFFSTSLSSGSVLLHSGVALGHLVLNGQPVGALRGDGISPSKIILLLAFALFGSGSGMAESNETV